MAATITLFALTGALLGAAGCAPAEKPKHPVVLMAPFDLDCPDEKLSYTQIGDQALGVTGCGRRAKYVELCSSNSVGLLVSRECQWVRN